MPRALTQVRRRPAATLLAGLLAATAAAACDPSSYQFQADRRLTITSPASQAKLAAPFTISWRMTDFEATGLDGSRTTTNGVYAVFLDRPPMPAGKTLRSVFDGDPACKADLRCPDATYLADHSVYVTTDTTVEATKLPPVAKGLGDEQHTITVVLLDGTGTRIGESAWFRSYSSNRQAST